MSHSSHASITPASSASATKGRDCHSELMSGGGAEWRRFGLEELAGNEDAWWAEE